MMGNGFMGGEMGTWMTLFAIVIFVDLVLLGAWLWKQLTKK
jgi:hypothetical protein